MGAIFSWLASFLTGPLLKAGIDVYKVKLEAGNNSERIAADLAGRELVVQQAEIAAQNELRIAQLGRWYEPEKLMGYAVALYFGKLLIWDKVLALGSTDPLAGWASTTANIIVMFYFSKRGIENVARILKR